MTQTRIHDYRAPRSTADLNRKFVGLMAPGVYQGFHVSNSGLLAPGVLLTAEGVRIEENGQVQLILPPNLSPFPRRDIVVCTHEYQPTVPAPAAVFQVIPGTPAADPQLPVFPEHATLLAVCRMAPGGSTWDEISQNSNPPELLFNARRDGWDHRIISGGNGALLIRTVLVVGGGALEFYIHPGTGLADGETIPWGSPVFTFNSEGTPAGIIRIADEDGKFVAETVEAALSELAGQARTTETVAGNTLAISQEISDRQTADSILQGQITDHLGSSAAHNASDIPIADTDGRYSAENVEAALQEIVGQNRTTETVKGNADAISGHMNDSTGAHAASAISTTAVSGSPFSLNAGQVQGVLTSIVAALNSRALKGGDTFSGPVTFQNNVTFDADNVDGIAFDEDIWFFRTIPAIAGRGIDGLNPAPFNDTFGGVQFSQVGHHFFLPIPGIASGKISKVRFYFQVPPNTTGRATLTLKVTSTPSFYAGESATPTVLLSEFSLETADPANGDPDKWTTYQHELDLGDLGISPSDFTKMVFASVIMTGAAGSAIVFPGVKVAHKRTRVAV